MGDCQASCTLTPLQSIVLALVFILLRCLVLLLPVWLHAHQFLLENLKFLTKVHVITSPDAILLDHNLPLASPFPSSLRMDPLSKPFMRVLLSPLCCRRASFWPLGFTSQPFLESISASQLINHKCIISFDVDSCFVQDCISKQPIRIGHRHVGLYYIDHLHLPSTSTTLAPIIHDVISSYVDLWHRRLGHISSAHL